jgi:hypothetical protein
MAAAAARQLPPPDVLDALYLATVSQRDAEGACTALELCRLVTAAESLARLAPIGAAAAAAAVAGGPPGSSSGGRAAEAASPPAAAPAAAEGASSATRTLPSSGGGGGAAVARGLADVGSAPSHVVVSAWLADMGADEEGWALLRGADLAALAAGLHSLQQHPPAPWLER